MRAAVVDAGSPGGPSISHSAAGSMQYWRLRDVATKAWSRLQTCLITAKKGTEGKGTERLQRSSVRWRDSQGGQVSRILTGKSSNISDCFSLREFYYTHHLNQSAVAVCT